MPYVQRNETGVIDGLFANPQPGFAEEFLADDDPAVVAFLTPSPMAQFNAQLDLGLDVVWLVSTDLNGIYAIDPQTQFNITAETVTLLISGGFSTGGSSRTWLNMAGQEMLMSVAQFKAFGQAVSSYISGLYAVLAALQAGQSMPWPGNNATINM